MTSSHKTTLDPSNKVAWLLLPLLTTLLLAGAPAGAGADLMSAPPPHNPTWRMQCIDCPQAAPRVGERSLALDSAGRPHVVYGGENLHFAWRDGAVWRVEVVDAAPKVLYGVQAAAALDLDGNDQPHIAYLNSNATALRYAHKTANGWQLQTVATTTPDREMSYDVSLRVNRAGHPLIAYSRYGALNLAIWTGSRWDIQPVDYTSWVEWYISLALDATDQPHISYFWATRGQSEIRYARLVSGRWVIETVDQAVWVGEFNSLALDSQGMPFITYLDASHSQLKLARRTPTGWQVEVIDNVQWPGGYTSLTVDNADHLHVTYAGPPVGVRYATWDGAAWHVETLASNGWYTSLALDGTSRPHMVFFDTRARQVTYGVRTFTGWTWQAIDSMVDPGQHAALARAPDAALAVAYYEAGHGDLRLARQSNAGWQVETVDAAGDVGRYAALAFTAGGLPRVSYYDATHGDLKVARRGPNRWVVETVDAAGDVGQFTSLTLDSLDQPLVAYYDATQGDLKLARRDSAGRWTIEVTAAEGDVGRYPSLALDPAGAPFISFYDATRGDLCVASRREGRWVVEVVDAAGDVGRYTALAFDASGNAHISYYDATNGDLKYAVRRDGAWAVATVDAAGNVGLHTSLALDSVGRPHIAAVTAGNDALRYAWWNGEDWQVQTVRAGWQTASFPALILEQGRPRIAFYDPGWSYLRLAWGEPFGLYLPLVE